MKPRAPGPGWARLAAAVAAVSLAALLAGSVREHRVPRGPAEHVAPCVFSSATLMPVAETRATGYSNGARLLVDAKGTAWIAIRTKHGSQYTIGLVRAAAPWRAGMAPDVTWIEDRDSLAFSGAPQRVAAIAAAPDGSIHMAWYGGIAGAADHQIHYARFTTGNATRISEESAPFSVPGFEAVSQAAPTPIELWQEHPAIAVGRDGTVHLVWEARDPFRRSSDGVPRPGIAYATRTRDGVWSVSGALAHPPYLQVDDGSPAQSRPSVLVDSAGLVHVLCYGSVGGVQQILYGTNAARGFSGWKPIAPSAKDQRHTAAALDAQGRLHVVWREGSGKAGLGATSAIFYSVRETDGRWHRPTRLTPEGENASTPSVGVTDSSVCVAWVAWDPGAKNSDGQADNGFPADNSTVEGRIEVSSSLLAREDFDTPVVVDAGPASYPCWAMGPTNRAPRPALAWTSIDPSSGPGASLKLGWCERGK